jgi:peptidyl-prolyl cis-trans isomerase C
MKKSLIFITALFFFAGCASKPGGTVLARFDGTALSESDFDAKVASMPKDLQSLAKRRKKDFVEEMVNEHFLEKEAMRRSLHKDPDVKQLIEAAHRKITIAKLVEIEVDKKVALEEGEALNYYELHQEEFMTPLLLRASHILLSTAEEANEVRAELDKGGDFEELARRKSQDSTAIRGGDLGFFQKGQLIQEFEDIAFKMKKGEISPVFSTRFGVHILKLTDRGEPVLRNFKSVKGVVEKQLLNAKKAKRYKEFVDELKGGSKVEMAVS